MMSFERGWAAITMAAMVSIFVLTSQPAAGQEYTLSITFKNLSADSANDFCAKPSGSSTASIDNASAWKTDPKPDEKAFVDKIFIPPVKSFFFDETENLKKIPPSGKMEVNVCGTDPGLNTGKCFFTRNGDSLRTSCYVAAHKINFREDRGRQAGSVQFWNAFYSETILLTGVEVRVDNTGDPGDIGPYIPDGTIVPGIPSSFSLAPGETLSFDYTATDPSLAVSMCDTAALASSPDDGYYQLTATRPQPPGETCDNPINVTLPPTNWPYTDTNTTCGMGNDYSETCLGYYDDGEDIIYEVLVVSAVTVDISLTSDASWVGMCIDNMCPPGASCIALCTTSGSGCGMYGVALVAGTYYIMIDTWPSPTCINQFTLTIDQTGVQPGDGCADAIVIPSLPYTDTKNSCVYGYTCGSSTAPDLFYKYTVQAPDEFLTVSLMGSSYDTYLYVWSECCVTQLAFNDDFGGTLQSQITRCFDAGDIWIEVSGYSSNCGTALLTVTSAGECPPPPPNDLCANAQVLTVNDPNPTCGNNSGATGPDCPEYTFPDLWYTFTLTECMNVGVEWCGTTLSGSLYPYMYTDCNCGGAMWCTTYELTTCADGLITMHWNNLPAGQYFYPFNTDGLGDFCIRVTAAPCPPPPPNPDSLTAYRWDAPCGPGIMLRWTPSGPPPEVAYYNIYQDRDGIQADSQIAAVEWYSSAGTPELFVGPAPSVGRTIYGVTETNEPPTADVTIDFDPTIPSQTYFASPGDWIEFHIDTTTDLNEACVCINRVDSRIFLGWSSWWFKLLEHGLLHFDYYPLSYHHNPYYVVTDSDIELECTWYRADGSAIVITTVTIIEVATAPPGPGPTQGLNARGPVRITGSP